MNLFSTLTLNQKSWAISLLVVAYSFFFVQWNSQYLSPEELYPNSMIIETADDYSYIQPMENFAKNGTWDNRSTGMTRYAFRSQGVGVWVYLHKICFGENAYRMLLISHLILFGLQTFLFAKLIFYFTKSEKASVISQLIYGILPCNFAFVSYAISEPLTPFFLLLSLWTTLRLKDEFNSKNLIFAVLSSALCLSIRPQLLPFVLGFILIVWIAQSWKRSLVFGSIVLLPMLVWVMRTHSYTQKWSIHPIYHNTNSHLYNPMHQEMTNLFRVWEHNEVNFHRVMNQAWNNSSNISIDFHSDLTEDEKHRVISLLDKFRLILQDYREVCNRREMMPAELRPDVKKLITEIKNTRSELIRNHPSLYYLKTPINSLVRLTLKSGFTFRAFQSEIRGVWWGEVTRWICFLVLVTSLLVSVVGLFLFKNSTLKVLSAVVLSYLYYLSFFQRLNEDRYLYPIYAISILLLFIFLRNVKSRLIS